MNILVTALSMYRENHVECDYCFKKDDKTYYVSGSHTNEPVLKSLSLYLKDKGECFDKVITICTSATLQEREDNKSDFGRFTEAMQSFFEKEETPIPEFISLCIEDLSDSSKIFAAGMEIVDIMSTEDKPCVFVDSTGGFRDAMMLIISTMQLMKERNINMSDVLYTVYDRNLPPPYNIISRKDAYSVYDLVSGMDELRTYGDPSKLMQYFSEYEPVPGALEILNALKSVYTEMQLNRVIQSKEALERLCSLMSTYKPCNSTFDRVVELAKIKYNGFDAQSSSFEYIKWYYEHGYISQTLSFFYEILPDILVENKILYASDEIVEKNSDKSVSLVTSRGWNHYFINTFFKEIYCPHKLKARVAREELQRLANDDVTDISETGNKLLEVISFILSARENPSLLKNPPAAYREFVEKMQSNNTQSLSSEKAVLSIKNKRKFFNMLKSNENTIFILYDIERGDDSDSAEKLAENIVSSVDNHNIFMNHAVSKILLGQLLEKYFYLKTQRNSVLHVGNKIDSPEVLSKNLGEAIALMEGVLESANASKL